MTTKPIEIGSRVRHKDGRTGTVVHIHAGSQPGDRLVEWKSLGQWYLSGESALTVVDAQQYRWRRDNGKE